MVLQSLKEVTDNMSHSPEEDDEDDIWPEDVEKCFQEALKIYPPVGRRKLLQDGKMFGRNELIAKYIYQKTGKIRTRKQVSSHIQVLGKKHKKFQESTHSSSKSRSSVHHESRKDNPSHHSTSTSSQSSSHQYRQTPVSNQNMALGQMNNEQFSRSSMGGMDSRNTTPSLTPLSMSSSMSTNSISSPPYSSSSTSMATNTYISDPPYSQNSATYFYSNDQKVNFQGLRTSPVILKHFSAYLEYPNINLSGMVNRHYYINLNSNEFNEQLVGEIELRQIENKYFGLKDLYAASSFPCFYFATCAVNIQNDQTIGLHALYVKYESKQKFTLKCSTTVYSFGKAVVEKIQVEDAIPENTQYAYYFNHSPMCDYMVQFIRKLKSLDGPQKMNRVLEHFSVLQVIIDTQTNTTLLSVAFHFSVAENGAELGNQVYRIFSQ